MLNSGLGLLSAMGLSMFCGGSISNLIDRIAFGRVVDFLNFGWGAFKPYIFNLADIFIGVGLFLTSLSIAAGFLKLAASSFTVSSRNSS